MGPAKAIRTGFAKTFRYSGRAVRAEFWWLVLATFLGFVAAVRLDIAVFGRGFIGMREFGGTRQLSISGEGPFAAVFFLLMFFPTLAASVRRMHDRGRSGWWLAVPFLLMLAASAYALLRKGAGTVDANGTIHFIGWAALPMVALLLIGIGVLFWNFFSLLRRSQPGPNKYGPNPLEVTS